MHWERLQMLSDEMGRQLASLGTKLTFLWIAMFVAPVAFAAPPAEQSSSQASARYFTVADSIEMVRFGLDVEPIFSADGKNLAVVTSRGIIEKNEVESSIWIFATEEVRHLLRGNEAETPTPKLAVRLAVTPTIEHNGSYEPVIENLRC